VPTTTAEGFPPGGTSVWLLAGGYGKPGIQHPRLAGAVVLFLQSPCTNQAGVTVLEGEAILSPWKNPRES